MKGQLNVAKSMGGDVFADDSEVEPEDYRLAYGGVLVCHGRIVLCFP